MRGREWESRRKDRDFDRRTEARRRIIILRIFVVMLGVGTHGPIRTHGVSDCR